MSKYVATCLVFLSLFFNAKLLAQFPAASSCSYTLQLFDSAANGWDGARLEISINNGPIQVYSLTAAQGAQASYSLDVANGSIIDIAYVGGANENEHTYILQDPVGAQLFSDGPFPAETSIPTVKVTCPSTCIKEEDFLLLITMGDNPEQMSWELTDASGARVSFSNANAYNGFPSGFVLPIPVNLTTCEAYTFTAFDGFNDGWNGGSFQLISDNQQRGSLISAGTYEGFYEILSGPGNFIDQASSNLTLPCFECGETQIVVANVAGFSDCIQPGFIYPFDDLPTPLVCYPNVAHGNPAPIMTVSYPSAIPAITNANVGVAVDLPIGSNDAIFSVEYNDGQIIRCTSEVIIVTEANPTLVCNDNLNIALNDVQSNANCVLALTPDMVLEGPSNCEDEYIVKIFDSNGQNLGNVIDPSFVGLILDYQVQHLASLNSCWGTITIEDKTAPHINCFDYSVACNHPNFMDEDYSYRESYLPNDNTLPANIAGGAVAPSPPSITTLPIHVECGPLGEVVENVTVSLNIDHTEIGDLSIILLAPNGMSKTLMNTGTCVQGGAENMVVTFNSLGSNPSIDNSCDLSQSPVINGIFKPIDNISFSGVSYSSLAGEWSIIITDNNNTIFGDPVVGLGEVVNASISIDAGFPTPFTADDCSAFSTELVSEFIEDTNCSNPWTGAVVNRLWKATDAVGNASTCSQKVSLITPTISDINLPEDIILECGAIPEVEVAGIPRFDCFDLADDQHVVCDFTYVYEDTEVSSCGISRKIFRDWTVINWCTTVSISHRQTIEIKDTEGPVLGIEDISTGTSLFKCGADVFLSALATDACSSVEQISASYTIPGPIQGSSEIVIVDITNGELVTDLPLGDTEISITAMDACGNSTVKLITVTIEDNATPVAVCDDQLRVSLGGGGIARLTALDIDEGSVDNCGIESYQVRRLGGCLPGTPFGDFVDFECCDAGESVNVELLVTDAAGNSASCWLTVAVEDKSAPSISCPSDKAFTCEENISDFSVFGNASAIDNCDASIEESSITNIDNCGAGEIIRTFIATDNFGNSSECSQRITISHVSDFTVQFPADLTLNSCSVDLDELSKPIIGMEDCELIATSYEDEVFELVQDACTKIVRTWTVINWCIYETGNSNNTELGIPLPIPRTFTDDGDGFFQYTQIIEVIDNEAPIFDPTSLLDVTVEITNTCSATYNVPNITALDECSGEIIVQPSPRSVTGTHLESHEITFVASDGCGNVNIESIHITFVERKAPTPVCETGLVAEIDSHLKEITIWAIDFESGSSFDNCTAYEDLQFSFSENANDISKTFDCSQLGLNDVEIWVTDEFGNQDFCITTIEIQDNLNACDPGTGTGAKAIIGGVVETEMGAAIVDVQMDISGSNTATTNTDQNGGYDFVDLDVNGNYVVGAAKNNDPNNGVSTFDLVLIARHILQITPFENPYKLIASDVDDNQTVDIFDMIAIRQLVLRAVDTYPNGYSWKFIEKDFVFTNPLNPWLDNFDAYINANNLTGNKMDADFIGVKLGDVDNSAEVNINSPRLEERNLYETELSVVSTSSTDEDEVIFSFYPQEELSIQGLQFELSFDNNNFEFLELISKDLNLNERNLSTRFIEEGKMLVSWNESNFVSTNEFSLLFELKFKKLNLGVLDPSFEFSDELLNSEIYVDKPDPIYALGLSMALDESRFNLVQNSPNPFTQSTSVEFYLNNTDPAEIKVFDLQGRLVNAQFVNPVIGKNLIQFTSSDFNGAGVYYLRLISGDKQSVIKMIMAK